MMLQSPDYSKSNADELRTLIEGNPSPQNQPVQPVVSETQIIHDEAQTDADLATVNREIADTLVNLSSAEAQPRVLGSPSVNVGNTPPSQSLANTIPLLQQGLENIEEAMRQVADALQQLTSTTNQLTTTSAQGTMLASQMLTEMPTAQALAVQAANQAAAASIRAQTLISLAQSSIQSGKETSANPVQPLAASRAQMPGQTLIQIPQASGSALDDIQQVVQGIPSIITSIIGILGIFL